jgi:multidrug resistance efflux pump
MNEEVKPEQVEDKGESAPQKDPVKKWTRILLILALILFALYLMADRFTPFSSQARVNAYVVPIAPEVSGQVISVDVQNNTRVSAGDRLLQIDPEMYRLALDGAKAAYQSVLQSVEAGESNVESARSQVDSARAKVKQARQDTERMRRIRAEDPGAISERRIESAEANLEAAQSSLLAAEAGVQAAIAALGATDESNAALQQARAAVEQAQVNLDKTSVLAPTDGMITDLRVDTGNFAAAGHALMTFIAIHDTWVQADFTENNLGHVDVGDRVLLVFDVQPGKVFEGTVRHVGYGVAVQNNPLGSLPTIDNQRSFLRQAQRFPVTIEYDADPGEIGLRVGSQASAVILTGTHPILNTLARMYVRLYAWVTYLY